MIPKPFSRYSEHMYIYTSKTEQDGTDGTNPCAMPHIHQAEQSKAEPSLAKPSQASVAAAAQK